MSTSEDYGMCQVESALTPFRENEVDEVRWDLIGESDTAEEPESRDPYNDLESVRKTLDWLYSQNVVNYQEHNIQETEGGVEVEFRVEFYDPRQRRDHTARIESRGYNRDRVIDQEPQTGMVADD